MMGSLRSFTERHASAMAIVAGVWIAQLALWALLGALGLGASVNIWPLGEDRNWIDLLSKPSAGDTARGFWSIDHRNPLSPWWYLAFKPLILKWPFGLFLLRHLVGLALALSTYALAMLIMGERARRFAVAVACLIAIFSANAFFDQIYWNFEVALAASLLCVCCFIRHQKGEGRGGWLAAALVLWLIAISTYTIQTGAIVAIGYWALRHGATGQLLASAPRRVGAAIAATWPFLAILIVFVLIWQTTSVPSGAFIGGPSFSRLIASLRMGAWHVDSALMAAIWELSPHRALFAIVAVFVGVLAAAAVWLGGAPQRDGRIFDFAIVILSLALPTLVVETIGAQWPPGSRWRMIYQVTTPALYLSAAFVALLAIRSEIWRRGAWAAACGVLFGLSVLASLSHNERQASLTKNERLLRDVILRDAAKYPSARLHYLIFLDERFRWFALDTLSPVYARTWFGAAGPTFRLAPIKLYEGMQPGPPVALLGDEQGVANATVSGETLPYDRIRAVRWSGDGMVVVDRLERQDVERFRLIWDRAGPALLGPRQ